MSSRAANHFLTADALARLRKASAARSTLAVLLLAVATLARFAASWHEASVQHVRCAEHGELTHVRIQLGTLAANDPRRAAPAHDGVNRGDEGARAIHEHCDLAFVVQGSAQTQAVRTTVRVVPPSVTVASPAPALPAPARTFILASAPKTSPPVA